MSSKSDSASWLRYSNEKLYLANLQIRSLRDLECASVSESSDSCLQSTGDDLHRRGYTLSYFWAGTILAYTALEGLLCEIAESNQKRVIVKTVEALGQLLGPDSADYTRLQEIGQQTDSWLWVLSGLKEVYDSPSTRIEYDVEPLNSDTDEPFSSNAHYDAAIIATSGVEDKVPEKVKSHWKASELTSELLGKVVAGLTSYMKEVRASAVEW